MNLLGEIVNAFETNGWPVRLPLGRVLKDICLSVVTNATPGNTVLVCDAVAIGKMENGRKENNVPSDSW